MYLHVPLQCEGLGLQFYLKEAPTQVLFCQICEIVKNTYFEEHLQTTASTIRRISLDFCNTFLFRDVSRIPSNNND